MLIKCASYKEGLQAKMHSHAGMRTHRCRRLLHKTCDSAKRAMSAGHPGFCFHSVTLGVVCGLKCTDDSSHWQTPTTQASSSSSSDTRYTHIFQWSSASGMSLCACVWLNCFNTLKNLAFRGTCFILMRCLYYNHIYMYKNITYTINAWVMILRCIIFHHLS